MKPASASLQRISQTADLKHKNAALVMYALLTRPNISRSEIVRLTSLAPSTVSNITGTLLENGTVKRVGNIGQTGAGRKSDILARNPQAAGVGAIHITPERCTVGIVNLGYEVVQNGALIFENGFTEQHTDSVLDELDLLTNAAGERGRLAAVGLAVPNYPYNIFEIERMVRERYSTVPVFRINNTEAMAVHEYYLRLGHDYNTVAYVYVGTGIGSGFIIDGDLYRGVNGNACDLGHMYVTDRPLVCRCGREGCVETVASERALAEQLKERFDLPELPVRDQLVSFVAARLRTNDSFCEQLLREAAEYLGKAIFNLVAITDPEVVIVAGRLNALNPLFSSLVEESYMTRARRIAKAIVPIEFVPLHDDAGLVGAAMFSFINLFCGADQATAVAV